MTRIGLRAALAAALALTGAGCEGVLGLGTPTLAVDGGGGDTASGNCDAYVAPTTRQFVIASFDAPSNSAEVQAAAFDLDGDGGGDNALGSELASLAALAPELDLQATIDTDLASGALLQLLEAELAGGCGTTTAMTTLYEGADRDVPVDPTDNFSGEESFRVVGILRGRMAGRRDGAAVALGAGGTAELRLPLFAHAAPLDLPLIEARIRYVVTDDGAIQGAIGGAIRSDVVDGLVIPSLASSVQPMIVRDCAGSIAPLCCEPDSDGQTLVSLFDKDDDCMVSAAEVRSAPLIMALFAADLDLYAHGELDPAGDGDPDAVSIAVAFTAVNAFFLTPTLP